MRGATTDNPDRNIYDRDRKYETLATKIADAITNAADKSITVNRYVDGELNIDVPDSRRFAFRIMVEDKEYAIVIGPPDLHLGGWYTEPFGAEEPTV